MGDILKFVAFAFLIVLLLTFTLPLLSLVINMSGWFFGDFFDGLFSGIAVSDILWIVVIGGIVIIGLEILSNV